MYSQTPSEDIEVTELRSLLRFYTSASGWDVTSNSYLNAHLNDLSSSPLSSWRMCGLEETDKPGSAVNMKQHASNHTAVWMLESGKDFLPPIPTCKILPKCRQWPHNDSKHLFCWHFLVFRTFLGVVYHCHCHCRHASPLFVRWQWHWSP